MPSHFGGGQQNESDRLQYGRAKASQFGRSNARRVGQSKDKSIRNVERTQRRGETNWRGNRIAERHRQHEGFENIFECSAEEIPRKWWLTIYFENILAFTLFVLQFQVAWVDSAYRMGKYFYECGKYMEAISYLYFCLLVMQPTDKVNKHTHTHSPSLY